MKDFQPIRDNIKRLIKKHGFKYLTFSEQYLNTKYNTFDRHLRYGRIQLKHVYIMMDLLSCDFYTLTGEQQTANGPTLNEQTNDLKDQPNNEINSTPVQDKAINTPIEPENDDNSEIANLDFLSTKA